MRQDNCNLSRYLLLNTLVPHVHGISSTATLLLSEAQQKSKLVPSKTDTRQINGLRLLHATLLDFSRPPAGRR
jgi:hypothetical protein